MINGLFTGAYWFCKSFFSLFWLIYLLSIWYQWDGWSMWHIAGIVSILYFITNIRWWTTTGGQG